MPRAEASATVSEDADALWLQVGGFLSVGSWHPMLVSVHGDGEQAGSRRTAQAQDGTQQVERLDSVDPTDRSYRYSMESTSLPVTDYTAEFWIEPVDDRSCIVHWESDFKVTSGDEEDAVGMVQGFLTAGVDELSRRYG